ncbi:MAG TPA: hypothetical protein VGM07_08550 [Stellaceae bacterium]|jgi:hypothetical protein
MGEIVTLPARADLDKLGRYAALAIMAVELARIATQGEAGEVEIILNGERQRLARADMLAIAQGMLEQRQAVVDAMGERAGAELVERVARAFAVMQEAEAMLADATAQAGGQARRRYRGCRLPRTITARSAYETARDDGRDEGTAAGPEGS